jgi:hypothetical protein
MRQEVSQLYMVLFKSSFLVILWLAFNASSQSAITIDNPYAGIQWSGESAWQRHKANFHTHTTQSDGAMAPDVVIDQYHEKGYTILAITDHNKNTWPWTNWDRDPAELGMLAISGNEFSSGHHRASLFNTIDGNPGSDVKSTLNQIADAGGLSMLYHPGRYSESIDWYVDIYKTIATCIGMEVFNQNDRFPNDRATWDSVLTRLMPARPVWGYANDDMHTTSHLFRGYNIIFVEELTESNVRQALQLGRSYFSYEPGRTGNALAPSIDSITLDTIAMTITVFAKNHNDIQWISSGKIVGNDSVFSYAQSNQLPYVRARIIGSNGETHTQPFGIRTHLELDTAILIDTGQTKPGDDKGAEDISIDTNSTALVHYNKTDMNNQQIFGEDLKLITEYISNGLIHLSIKQNILIDHIKITDLMGRTIQHIHSPYKEHLVDVSNFSRGIYILTAYSMGRTGSTVIRIE